MERKGYTLFIYFQNVVFHLLQIIKQTTLFFYILILEQNDTIDFLKIETPDTK